jgi:hypothetical protein
MKSIMSYAVASEYRESRKRNQGPGRDKHQVNISFVF